MGKNRPTMRTKRWQNLDRLPPDRLPQPGADPAPPVEPAGAAAPRRVLVRPDHPDLAVACGHYHLRQFHDCAEAVEALLARQPELPGARRLLGLARGQLGEYSEAVRHLGTALAQDPEDTELRASFLSARLAGGEAPEEPLSLSPPPLAELAGAAEWLRGQADLRGHRVASAARAFARAGDLLASSSPPESAGERVAACYVGQAVSHLVGGELDQARHGFSRLQGRESVPPAALRFARQLYEVADALADLEPAERPEAAAPLADLVARARLRLRFYDGRQPVAMHWDLW